MSQENTEIEIQDETLLQRNPEIVSTEIDGETVMMDGDFDNYFGMGAIATRIWSILEEKTSFGELCSKMTAEFQVEEDQCREDVLNFLIQLQENGMLLLEGNGSDS